MIEEKRFGKLSVDHVRQLMAYLPILEQARPELAELMAAKPEKAASFFEPGLAWAGLYDLTIVEHLAVFFEVAGLSKFLINAAASADPLSEMMKLDATTQTTKSGAAEPMRSMALNISQVFYIRLWGRLIR